MKNDPELSYKNNHISQEEWYVHAVSPQTVTIELGIIKLLIPLRKNLFINSVYVPPMMQRFFLPDHIEHPTFAERLILELMSRYPSGNISLSENITIKGVEKFQKTNYLLPLNQNYDHLQSGYRKGHKLNLKTAFQHNIKIFESDDIKETISFYKKFSNQRIPKFYKNEVLLSSCITSCINHKCGIIVQASTMDNQLLSIAFFSIYNKRITYHLSCSSPEGKQSCAMYGIIDYIIRKYQQQQVLLDFEGSSIPGLAKFMSGFGAKEEHYYNYQWNRNPVLKLFLWLKRLF